MTMLPLRQLELPAGARQLRDEWLADLDSRLRTDGADWNLIVRDTLFELAYPGHGTWQDRAADPKYSLANRIILDAFDPRNVTLEPEYYGDVDVAKFARVKPLLWLWYSFDRLPVGGQNVDLGVEFRRMLASFLFERVGRNFKCFQHVEFSYGYQMDVGDDVVIHRHVLLDDRGGITLGDRDRARWTNARARRGDTGRRRGRRLAAAARRAPGGARGRRHDHAARRGRRGPRVSRLASR